MSEIVKNAAGKTLLVADDSGSVPNVLEQRTGLLARDSASMALRAAEHRIEYEDAAEWVETWVNLSEWDQTHAAVTGGGVHSDDGTNVAHLSRPFPAAMAKLRAIFKITIPAGVDSNSGLVLVGVTLNGDGVAPTSANKLLGVGLGAGDLSIWFWRGSDFATPATENFGTLPASATLYAFVLCDGEYLTIGLTNATRSLEYYRRHKVADLGGTLQGIQIWNSDSRQASGVLVEEVACKMSTASYRTSTLNNTVHTMQSVLSGTDKMNLWLPANYDSRKPLKLVLFSHGGGQSADSPWSDTSVRWVVGELLGAGYAVIAHDSAETGHGWGGPLGVADLAEMHSCVRDNYAVGPVFILAQSYGGLAALTALAGDELPGVIGWSGIYPVCNLRSIYDGDFTSQVAETFGVAGDGSDYAAKTAGYDPVLRGGRGFRGISFQFFASYDDTMVPRATNTDQMSELLTPYAREVEVIDCTGEHGDSSHFQPSVIIDFFERCIA